MFLSPLDGRDAVCRPTRETQPPPFPQPPHRHVALTYERDQASRFGVQPSAIDAVLYYAFGQREVAQYFTGHKAHYVVLEVFARSPEPRPAPS